jgi:hypothetical protein
MIFLTGSCDKDALHNRQLLRQTGIAVVELERQMNIYEIKDYIYIPHYLGSRRMQEKLLDWEKKCSHPLASEVPYHSCYSCAAVHDAMLLSGKKSGRSGVQGRVRIQ